jgi:hypothetical protein
VPSAASIPVRLEISPALVPHDTASRSGIERLAARVRRELAQVARGLGVVGTVEVTVVPSTADGTALRLFIHDVECRYPEETISRVWSSQNGRVLAPAERRTAPHGARGPRTMDLVAGVCRGIVARRPSRLLATGPAARYVRGTAAARVDPEWVLGTLTRVLDARLAITDRETVTALLAELEGKLCRQAAETIIERLRPTVVTVFVRREYLRELTTGAGENGDVLDDVRKRIEEDLGVAIPELRFVDDPSLHPRGVAFKVNDLTTLAWIGLPADMCLVGDSFETVRALGLPAEPALHPISERDSAVIPRARHADAASFHLRTWLPLDYLGLCLEATLRRHAACLIDSRVVQARLEWLELAGSSCAALGRRLPVGRIVRVMRALLDEGVSVSDFPGLIEVLVNQYERLQDVPAAGDPVWGNDADDVLEARDAEALAAARRRLARQVAANVVTDPVTQTVTAIVLDERLQQSLASACAAGEALPADDAVLVNSSVRGALGRWPRTHWPAMLTTTDLRGMLRQSLAAEFPDLSVVAFEELPVDVQIDIAATVSA